MWASTDRLGYRTNNPGRGRYMDALLTLANTSQYEVVRGPYEEVLRTGTGGIRSSEGPAPVHLIQLVHSPLHTAGPMTPPARSLLHRGTADIREGFPHDPHPDATSTDRGRTRARNPPSRPATG